MKVKKLKEYIRRWCDDNDDVLILNNETGKHFRVKNIVEYTERSPGVLAISIGEEARLDEYEDTVFHG